MSAILYQSEKTFPCPFCGGVNLIIGTTAETGGVRVSDTSVSVCCNALKGGCGGQGGHHPTIEGAIKLWNKRKGK